MVSFDIRNDVEPEQTLVGHAKRPSLEDYRTAIAASETATTYTEDYLRRLTKQDLANICRVEGIDPFSTPEPEPEPEP